MVRRRSTVRFRNGALARTLERWHLAWANQVRCHLCVLRLVTADTGSLRLVVPNTCPSLSGSLRARWGCRVLDALAALSPRASRWTGEKGPVCPPGEVATNQVHLSLQPDQ